MEKRIYGNELAKELKDAMKQKLDLLKEQGKRIPCLSVILVGENPASQVYVKGKETACASIGMLSKTHRMPATATQAELEACIRQCNEDPSVDGILVQLPLPEGFDRERAILCIDPMKDVDGLHPMNVGKFYAGHPAFVPCTPLGCMELLKKMGCDPYGKRAVVLGRSELVGSPVARLLQNANATVTICHSKTPNIAEIAKEADILVAAIGIPNFVTSSFIKEGAYVVDVGINRLADGKLRGDVNTEEVLPLVSAITPVPKGVGPMTICMLLSNTLKSYEMREA